MWNNVLNKTTCFLLFLISLSFCKTKNNEKSNSYVPIKGIFTPKYTKKVHIEDTTFLRYWDSLQHVTPNTKGLKNPLPYYPDKSDWKNNFDDYNGNNEFWVDSTTNHIRKIIVGRVKLDQKFFVLLNNLKKLSYVSINNNNSDTDSSLIWNCCGNATKVKLSYKKLTYIKKNKNIKNITLDTQKEVIFVPK